MLGLIYIPDNTEVKYRKSSTHRRYKSNDRRHKDIEFTNVDTRRGKIEFNRRSSPDLKQIKMHDKQIDINDSLLLAVSPVEPMTDEKKKIHKRRTIRDDKESINDGVNLVMKLAL